MSNHFNALAIENIATISGAIVETFGELPHPLVQCAQAMQLAVDQFAEAAYLLKRIDIETADYEFRRCKRSLKTALELLTAASIADNTDLPDEGSVPTLDEWCDDDSDLDPLYVNRFDTVTVPY